MEQPTLQDYLELHRREMLLIAALVEQGKYVDAMYRAERFFANVFCDYESLKLTVETGLDMLAKGEW